MTPDLEAAYLTLAAENARKEVVIQSYISGHVRRQDMADQIASLISDRDKWRKMANSGSNTSEKQRARAVKAETELATLQAENHVAIIQRAEVVERLMADIATLRASEAAALERAEKAERRIAFLEAPVRQAFTIKSECDVCGRQSIDLLPGCACPKWNCGGVMVAKIGGAV